MRTIQEQIKHLESLNERDYLTIRATEVCTAGARARIAERTRELELLRQKLKGT